MSTIELRRRRSAGELVGDALRMWASEARRLIAIAATVIVPAYLIVPGIGLEQLWSEYDDTAVSPEAALIPIALDYLVTMPLIVAMTASLLTTPGGSRSVSRAVGQGLDAYRWLFPAVALAAVGVAAGVLLFILPGIYLAIRWYLTPWMVLLERARGPEALRRSGELVSGSWWRTLGVLLLASLVSLVPALVFVVPFEVAGDASDLAVLSLVGQTLGSILIYPYVAVVGTLLYFDLRARKEGAPATPPSGPPSGPPSEPPDPPGLPPRR